MSVTMHTALRTLYERAKDSMTIEELKSISGLVETAGAEAGRLSTVCDGIACLVLSDGDAKLQCGSFRAPSSLFELLCSLSHGLDAIASMIEIGQEADFRAHELAAGREVRRYAAIKATRETEAEGESA